VPRAPVVVVIVVAAAAAVDVVAVVVAAVIVVKPVVVVVVVDEVDVDVDKVVIVEQSNSGAMSGPRFIFSKIHI
jgi:hypothetical protein